MVNTNEFHDVSKTIRARERRAHTKQILETVRDVCKKHNGQVLIGDGFVAVDTRLYKVMPR